MKKSFCLILLCLFSSAVYGADKVQPFIDCVITSSLEGLHHHLNYSPGFPVQESKLFLILRYGNTVKRAEIPLQKTISFEWKDSPGKTAFCSSNIKWEFPRVTNVSIKNELMPSKILFPGRKVVLMTWKTTSLADGKTLEQFCGETGLELQVPEHILKKYAGCMSYEDLVMQKFLKKLNVPDYWQFAKKFPAIPPKTKCKYLTYPEMIRGNVVELWDKYQREFYAGQITSLTFLELEIRIMEVMLYAQNLPEPMRKKLVMEQCRRYKKILSFTETAFAAGGETKGSVDIAKSNLKRFMQKHSHLISCASAENKESIRKYQSYIFIDDINNCYMCGKYDKFSCNLSVEKSDGYNYKINISDSADENNKSCLYGKFNIIDRNDGTFAFVRNALSRSDFSSQMRSAEVALIKYDKSCYYWMSITIQNQKEFYIVNIVSPAGDKIKNVNVINASDEYPEDIENLIKQSLKKHSVKS